MSKAARAYKAFHGDAPKKTRRFKVKPMPRELWAQGRIIGISYEAERDGKKQRFLHKFRGKSAPYLGVTPDGKQLFIVGGKYRVTDRGIEDG